jgi:hypothetical protein
VMRKVKENPTPAAMVGGVWPLRQRRRQPVTDVRDFPHWEGKPTPGEWHGMALPGWAVKRAGAWS